MLTNTLSSHTGRRGWMCATAVDLLMEKRGLGSGEKCGKDVTQEAFKDQNMKLSSSSKRPSMTCLSISADHCTWSRVQVCTSDICCLSVWNQLSGTCISSQNAIIKCCKAHYILVFAVLRVLQESDGRSIQKGALFCTCGCTFFLCKVILLAVILLENQDKLQSKVETFSFY